MKTWTYFSTHYYKKSATAMYKRVRDETTKVINGYRIEKNEQGLWDLYFSDWNLNAYMV